CRLVRHQAHATAGREQVEQVAFGAEDAARLPEQRHGQLIEEHAVLASGFVVGGAPVRGGALRAFDGLEDLLPHGGDFHQTTPVARSWPMTSPPRPRSCASTESVCSPSVGGAARMAAGVSDSLIGVPSTRMSPAAAWCIGTIISRAASCGSLNTSRRSRTDPHGTPAAVSFSIQ